ncbi:MULTISPECIES: winged helix-turn-helix domain-containing protein [Flavobacteriaceae]|uniref:GntR family transcriptional regulator n=1 Tax=Flavobacteriaceae TaxID=49546 RepID=UPI0014918B77|nr:MULTISPECIES: winged helix-turn-helix domain-containing protein [Allomuricauda]MDC6367637.1 GntR family transcriptional regulator [Muricauda sp. AC10]
MDLLKIDINEDSRVPKYQQIVDSIMNDIAYGKLPIGSKIPSINELSETLLLSRDTVEKAYRKLKTQKTIISVKGKGYYIAKTDLISRVNVFFLINKPSSYKMRIYNSFVNEMGTNGHVNLFIYHCEESLFVRYVERNLGAYDYYVIMPHFKDADLRHKSTTERVMQVLERIPKEKLLILDNAKIQLDGNYGALYQDFELDIYEALKEAKDCLSKYDKLILVYPSKSVFPYPARILFGFRKFCVEFAYNFEILDQIYDDMELQSKDAFITIEEMDLVNLVRQIRKKNLTMGKDVGIISYNDTPLKDLLGITVVSTDFTAMGETAAYMVLKKKQEKVKNVFKYIERNSI